MSEIEKSSKSYEEIRLDLLARREFYVPYLFCFPILVLIITFLFTRVAPIILGTTTIATLISFIFYDRKVGRHFNALKRLARFSLVEEFMGIYHPEVVYTYYPYKQNVEQVLDRVQLVDADIYKEEDVLTGVYKGADFYFSEIELKDEYKNSNGKTRTSTIFKGILFRLKIPGKNYPKTRIQSRRKLLQMLFSNFEKDEKHDLWYESKDTSKYKNSLQELLPFIAHLKRNQGDIRLQVEGDELVLLIKSKMKLLDDPKQHIEMPLDGVEYKTNIAKQLNTLLFIVDALVNNLDSSEIEDRLALKTLDEIRDPLVVRRGEQGL